ncbi:hypothetical protein A2U01_0108268, partial [Trifolium medium]|nr:hypothetical protein [Trifolium medium]
MYDTSRWKATLFKNFEVEELD